MPKATKTKPRPKSSDRIHKTELFAYAYIRHRGNGTAAAREVFNTNSDGTANNVACEYLRKPEVQKIIQDFLEKMRAGMDAFVMSQGDRLSDVAKFYREVMNDKDVKIEKRFEAAEQLSRLSGLEISQSLHHVEVERIRAHAGQEEQWRGRAVLPGVSAPGLQAGARLQQNNDNRKSIFLLRPPPIPEGGVPTPGLMDQWNQILDEMGFRPALAALPQVEENTANGRPPAAGGNHPHQ
jgi:phage terminase small subunit